MKLVPTLLAMAMAGIASLTSYAQVNSYTVSYSGGSCTTVNGQPGGNYYAYNGGWGFSATAQSVSCSGQVTIYFTWNGPNPPPVMATVSLSITESAWAYGVPGSQAQLYASNNLGDTPINQTNSAPPEALEWCGVQSDKVTPIVHTFNMPIGGGSLIHYTPAVWSSSPSESNSSILVTASAVPAGGGAAPLVGAATQARVLPISERILAAIASSLPTCFLLSEPTILRRDPARAG